MTQLVNKETLASGGKQKRALLIGFLQQRQQLWIKSPFSIICSLSLGEIRFNIYLPFGYQRSRLTADCPFSQAISKAAFQNWLLLETFISSDDISLKCCLSIYTLQLALAEDPSFPPVHCLLQILPSFNCVLWTFLHLHYNHLQIDPFHQQFLNPMRNYSYEEIEELLECFQDSCDQ